MTLYYYVVSGKGDDVVVHSKHRKKETAERRLATKRRQFQEAGIERDARIVEEYGYMDMALPSILRTKERGLI